MMKKPTLITMMTSTGAMNAQMKCVSGFRKHLQIMVSVNGTPTHPSPLTSKQNGLLFLLWVSAVSNLTVYCVDGENLSMSLH